MDVELATTCFRQLVEVSNLFFNDLTLIHTWMVEGTRMVVATGMGLVYFLAIKNRNQLESIKVIEPNLIFIKCDGGCQRQYRPCIFEYLHCTKCNASISLPAGTRLHLATKVDVDVIVRDAKWLTDLSIKLKTPHDFNDLVVSTQKLKQVGSKKTLTTPYPEHPIIIDMIHTTAGMTMVVQCYAKVCRVTGDIPKVLEYLMTPLKVVTCADGKCGKYYGSISTRFQRGVHCLKCFPHTNHPGSKQSIFIGEMLIPSQFTKMYDIFIPKTK